MRFVFSLLLLQIFSVSCKPKNQIDQTSEASFEKQELLLNSNEDFGNNGQYQAALMDSIVISKIILNSENGASVFQSDGFIDEEMSDGKEPYQIITRSVSIKDVWKTKSLATVNYLNVAKKQLSNSDVETTPVHLSDAFAYQKVVKFLNNSDSNLEYEPYISDMAQRLGISFDAFLDYLRLSKWLKYLIYENNSNEDLKELTKSIVDELKGLNSNMVAHNNDASLLDLIGIFQLSLINQSELNQKAVFKTLVLINSIPDEILPGYLIFALGAKNDIRLPMILKDEYKSVLAQRINGLLKDFAFAHTKKIKNLEKGILSFLNLIEKSWVAKIPENNTSLAAYLEICDIMESDLSMSLSSFLQKYSKEFKAAFAEDILNLKDLQAYLDVRLSDMRLQDPDPINLDEFAFSEKRSSDYLLDWVPVWVTQFNGSLVIPSAIKLEKESNEKLSQLVYSEIVEE